MSEQPGGSKPWYRVKMVWVVLLIPTIAVVLSMGYLTLSVVGADTTVRDDWYMDGKALQQDLSRDTLAAERKLQASLLINTKERLAKLKLAQPIDEPLTLIFSHAADKTKDFSLLLEGDALLKTGVLTSDQAELLEQKNKYYLELSAADWRLRQIATAPVSDQLLFMPLPAFTQLFENTEQTP